MSTKTLKLRKTQKFTFLKIQKTQNTGTNLWFREIEAPSTYLYLTLLSLNVSKIGLINYTCVLHVHTTSYMFYTMMNDPSLQLI